MKCQLWQATCHSWVVVLLYYFDFVVSDYPTSIIFPLSGVMECIQILLKFLWLYNFVIDLFRIF